MRLRDYQSTALRNTFAAWEEYDSALIVHPTGTGKTITSSHIIQQALAKFGGRAKVVAHRDELIRQAADKITRVSGLRCDIEMGEMKADTTLFGRAPVVVSSVQTQNAGMDGAGRMTKFDPSEFSILVIDECVVGETMVALADGTERQIQQIYNEAKPVKVLSYNVSSGKTEKKYVTGRKKTTTKEVCRIEIVGGEPLICTPEHLVFTNLGYLPAITLTNNHRLVYNDNHEQQTNTTRLRNTSRRRTHEARREVYSPKANHTTLPKTAGACLCEVRNPEGICRHTTEKSSKWWVGKFFGNIQHAKPRRVYANLRDMLSWKKEESYPRVAIQYRRRGIGVVVHGRRITANRWRTNIFRRFLRGGTRNNSKMVHGQVGNRCENTNIIKERLGSSWIQQARWSRVEPHYRSICDSIYEVQAIHSNREKLRELREGVLAKQQWKRSTNILHGSGMQNSDVQEKFKGLLPEKQRPLLRVGKVASVTVESRKVDVYDIEVEGNHNYFANGVLVHNCHHATAATYRRMINYYRRNKNLKILGITATPDRADKEALGQVFEVCVHDYELEDAIVDGWLVRPDQRCVTVSSLDISKVRTTAGDLNVGDLAEIMESETELHHIASPTYKIANGRKTLVFATTVAHAESLCEIFNRYKQGCASFVCGKTPKYERRQIFADYASGRTQFLCNVGVATEGFDDPGIEVVAIARPTKSRALYSQMVGRGTRPEEAIASHLGDIETAEGRRMRIAQSSKPHCEIIDFVGNSGKHKLVCTADILGGNYSDVVIDRARKIAEEADGELVDMDEALEAAAGQVKREEEKAREIQRRKHIIAEAEFVIEEIDPFDVFDVRAPREPGWHKGREPTEKQAAMLSGHGIKMDKMTFCKASRLISEITKRRKDGLCTFRQAEQLKKFGHRTDLTFDQARDTLSRAVVTPRKTIKVY